MAGKNFGPLWNQDTVTAAGLAFAGMSVLQSKLYPALAAAGENSLAKLLDWKVLEWWPLLLIVGGVVLWLIHVYQYRARTTPGSATPVGGRSERRQHN